MRKTENLQIFKKLVTNENVDEWMRSQEFPQASWLSYRKLHPFLLRVNSGEINCIILSTFP